MKHTKLAAVLAAMMITGTAAVSAAAPYTDLETLPSRNAIDYLYDTRCLTFAAGNQFFPQQALTRGELAQLIYNIAANIPISNPSFKDVTAGKAGDAIAAVAAQGILQGYEDGSFRPDEPVTREEFATVLYRYLQYNHLADKDENVQPYVDENHISPSALEAVQILHSKHIMVPADNMFRPKEYMTRAVAAEVIYRLMRSDTQYISHVQVEMQVMKALTAEYGSTLAFFRQGTMYWNDDTLVLGITEGSTKHLAERLKNDVTRSDAVIIRRVHLSRNDYTQLMNRAVNCVVEGEGVQNYVGSVPDYFHEQIVLTMRRPVSDATLQELMKRVGEGLVRIETVAEPGKKAIVQQVGKTTAEKTGPADGDNTYLPLVDQSTSKAINTVADDNLK